MKNLFSTNMRQIFLTYVLFFATLSCKNQEGKYVCQPCDLPCDKISFTKAGTCPHCKMDLILRTELESNLEVNKIEIHEGSGKFLMEGGFDKSKTILIHYYKPINFNVDSKIIFIVPGAGRNGKEYCDAWGTASEEYNLLVLSIEYSEEHYPGFWSYNLGGMIYDVDIQNETFNVNENSDQWIFGDFDRIFESVKTELHLTSVNYDMFGHSAGAQILHRLSIFKPDNMADRIIASNAGWYTIPDFSEDFPIGLKNKEELIQKLDFSNNLVLFLGEEDNTNETRGHLRRSPEVDKQGTHRLERGEYFFNKSDSIATQSNLEFNWKLEIIPNVGHDYEKISKHASTYLYGIYKK